MLLMILLCQLSFNSIVSQSSDGVLVLRESLTVTDRFRLDYWVLIHLLNLLQIALDQTLVQVLEVLLRVEHDLQATTPLMAIHKVMSVLFFLL